MKLVIAHSGNRALVGEQFELDPAKPNTIGRGARATIVVEGDGISRLHARIEASGDTWVLHDENSTNGVRLNDELVREAVLKSRDRLQIGDTLFFVDSNPVVPPRYVLRWDDGLTGLANLRHFLEQLEPLVVDESRRVALVRFGVEKMRVLNDTHGHLAGDAFLKELASRIRAEAPPEALVARISGDEIGVVLEGVDIDEATRFAADLRARVCARPFVIGDVEVRPGLHMGVATQGRSADELLNASKVDLQARRRLTSHIDRE
ncbi:MAG: GGDEF domain-containing protein [Polyangiaceae bacterium]|nr:GGDEF domain-containing protein [Polyangiaceae bacterium]